MNSRQTGARRSTCLVLAATCGAILVLILFFLRTALLREISSGAVKSQSDERPEPYFAVSPARDEIVFVGKGQGGSDLYRYDLHTHMVSAVLASPAMEWEPSFAPDARSLVLAQSESLDAPSSIAQMKVHDGRTQVFPHPAGCSDRLPSYSSDGSRIVFARAALQRPYSLGGLTWDNWDVYSMRRDGSDVRQITHNSYYELYTPRFSSDGKTILYAAIPRDGTVTCRVFVVSADGLSGPRQVGVGSEPIYCPDSTHIAFIADVTNHQQYDIVRTNLDGSMPASLQLVRMSDYNEYPQFSRDGKTIYFLADPHPHIHDHLALWSIDVAAGNVRTEATPELFDAPMDYLRPHKPRPTSPKAHIGPR